MAAPILVNGVTYNWSQLVPLIGTNVLFGITAISWKVKRNKTNEYGVGDQPIARSYGNVTYEGSITLYYDEVKKLMSVAPNGDLTLIAPFTIKLLYGVNSVNPNKDVLSNVEFGEYSSDWKQGDTKLTVTIPITFAGINL